MSNYADLTNLTDILKNVYGEGITNQFKDEKTTYNQFGKSDRKPGGKGYVFAIRYARTQSTGARAESKKLPDPFTGTKDNGTITPRYIYGTIRLTGPAIELAKGNPMSFVDSLADEMDDIYQSLIVDMNRQCWSDGFGKVATASAAATPSGTTTWAVTCDNDTGVMYVQEGMLVDFFDSTGATAVTTCCGQRVYSVNPTTKVITFEKYGQTYIVNSPDSTIAGYTNTATALAATDVLTKFGSRQAAHSSTNSTFEITGLDGLFDDGTLLASFEGITVASFPKWQANVLSNSGVNRELSLDLMLQACDTTRLISGMSVNLIRMGLGQRRKYVNLLVGDVRFQPTKLMGGYEILSFAAGDGSVEMLIDPLQQKNKLYFQPSDIIKKYELTALGWGNLDGDQMHRNAGYDEWDLFLRVYTQLGCENRNSLTLLKDLVEP